MQDKDITSSDYLRDETRTADLLNVVILHGRHLIRPEDIRELDSVSLEASQTEHYQKPSERVKKYRDVLHGVVFGCRMLIIGVENQDRIHYAMPVRTMSYDSARYQKQYRRIAKRHKRLHDLTDQDEYLSGFSAEDYLDAVMTLVIYYGQDHWRGPRCLKDMLRLEDIPVEFHQYINDYPLHIIEAAHFEDPELFETDLKLVFGCLKYQNQPEEFRRFLEKHRNEFQAMDKDAYDMIAAFGHSGQLKKIVNTATVVPADKDGKGGKVDMCKAIDEFERQAREEGKELGKELGRQEERENSIRLLISDNLEEGMTPKRIKEKLIRYFQLDAEQADTYYMRYYTG